MDPITLLIVVLLGLLLIPLILKWIQHILPLIRDRLAVALPSIASLMRSAFRWAGRLVTDDGELSPPLSVAQAVGAALMITAGVIFALCDFQFAWATLCPMFGGECKGEIFAGFDQLLGLSIVLLVVGFGLVISDLIDWTFVTKFARIERARPLALLMAGLCFVMSIAVGVAMAYYRWVVMRMGETDVPMEATAAWLQNLPAVILLPLAALLFIGAFFAFMNLETFFSAVAAFVLAVGGLGLGAVWLILEVVDLLAEMALAGVTTIPEATGQVAKSFQGGLRSVGEGMTKIGSGATIGGGALLRKVRDSLNHLVRPAAPRRPAVTTRADGLDPSESPSHSLGESMTAKPPGS